MTRYVSAIYADGLKLTSSKQPGQSLEVSLKVCMCVLSISQEEANSLADPHYAVLQASRLCVDSSPKPRTTMHFLRRLVRAQWWTATLAGPFVRRKTSNTDACSQAICLWRATRIHESKELYWSVWSCHFQFSLLTCFQVSCAMATISILSVLHASSVMQPLHISGCMLALDMLGKHGQTSCSGGPILS